MFDWCCVRPEGLAACRLSQVAAAAAAALLPPFARPRHPPRPEGEEDTPALYTHRLLDKTGNLQVKEIMRAYQFWKTHNLKSVRF